MYFPPYEWGFFWQKLRNFWKLEKFENMMKKVFFREKKNVFIFLEAFFTKAQNMPVVAGRLVLVTLKLDVMVNHEIRTQLTTISTFIVTTWLWAWNKVIDYQKLNLSRDSQEIFYFLQIKLVDKNSTLSIRW